MPSNINQTFTYKFTPTNYFLAKSAQIIAGFTYQCKFTKGFTPNYYGDKFFTNELNELATSIGSSITENINLNTQASELAAFAQTQTQEIDITNFAPTTDGVFLYTGSQVAFFSPIEDFDEIKKTSQGVANLEFYPAKNFAWKIYTESIFNTSTSYYYLGFGSAPSGYEGDLLDIEITDKNAEEKTPLARAYMSDVSFFWNESTASIVSSFPDVIYFGGSESQLVNVAFIIEETRDGDANAIFAAPVENEVLEKGIKYVGTIALNADWMMIA